jgi:hypothetical protein
VKREKMLEDRCSIPSILSVFFNLRIQKRENKSEGRNSIFSISSILELTGLEDKLGLLTDFIIQINILGQCIMNTVELIDASLTWISNIMY